MKTKSVADAVIGICVALIVILIIVLIIQVVSGTMTSNSLSVLLILLTVSFVIGSIAASLSTNSKSLEELRTNLDEYVRDDGAVELIAFLRIFQKLGEKENFERYLTSNDDSPLMADLLLAALADKHNEKLLLKEIMKRLEGNRTTLKIEWTEGKIFLVPEQIQ